MTSDSALKTAPLGAEIMDHIEALATISESPARRHSQPLSRNGGTVTRNLHEKQIVVLNTTRKPG